MNNGQRVRALREWAHRDESAAERQSRLERLVRAELGLERDLDAPIRWRPIAEAPRDNTHILLYSLLGIHVGFFSTHSQAFIMKYSCGQHLTPTHFAELKGPDNG